MALKIQALVLCGSYVLAQTSTILSYGDSTSSNSVGATTTALDISVDDLWNLFVGPVSIADTNSTVEATPVPSSELIPPPPLYYSPFPTGQQQPDYYARNESWSFPRSFWWGVASAAYQVEGAVKDEGRGPSIWDVLTHRVTNFVADNSTGDVADNQYYLYKQDIARIAALGIRAYSFSISWSRILPFGRGHVNEVALAHYDDVINTCLEYNIEPIVTLYHWDLPLYLQNLYGGWLSEEIVDDFVQYSRIVFQRYGDRVRNWFTLNEPLVFCSTYPLPEGYFKATDIPAIQQPYHCYQTFLLAHSGAYHAGRELGINGTISFKTNGGYKIPLHDTDADREAVQRAWDFNENAFAHPVWIDGDFPPALRNFTSTFLRPFTEEERSRIVNTSDVFAHDAYTSQFYFAPDDGIEACVSNPDNPLYPSCANTSYTYAAESGGWNIGPAADPGAPWLHKATDWVPVFLRYVQDTWNPQSIAVTEFGFAEPFEALKQVRGDILTDLYRSEYYKDYLRAILIAISEGVRVVGCLGWSIVDNLEWQQGYQTRFGMQYVNFTTQERFFKRSAFEFVDVFRQYQEQ